ncbi:Cationic amino acid transporter [Propionibacterium freudenreichii]|nr:Cationic amino acid transporter [Propionibacterium freudenreichii]
MDRRIVHHRDRRRADPVCEPGARQRSGRPARRHHLTAAVGRLRRGEPGSGGLEARPGGAQAFSHQPDRRDRGLPPVPIPRATGVGASDWPVSDRRGAHRDRRGSVGGHGGYQQACWTHGAEASRGHPARSDLNGMSTPSLARRASSPGDQHLSQARRQARGGRRQSPAAGCIWPRARRVPVRLT